MHFHQVGLPMPLLESKVSPYLDHILSELGAYGLVFQRLTMQEVLKPGLLKCSSTVKGTSEQLELFGSTYHQTLTLNKQSS